MLITEPISTYAKQHPHKPAIVSGDNVVTYHELHQSIHQVSEMLQAYAKTQPNNSESKYKIAILLANQFEFLYLFLGAAAAGWIAAPFDVKWNEKELLSTLTDCQPQLLVVDETYSHRLPSIPSTTKVLTINQNRGLEQWKGTSVTEDVEHFQSLTTDTTPFYMGFTSGTTGKPKAFIRSHKSWVRSFEGSQVEFGIMSGDHVLVPGPLVHSHFLYASVQAMFSGATVYLLDKFSPAKWIHNTRRYPISIVYMVPTMFEALFSELEGREGKNLDHQIRGFLSSGAKWSPASKQKLSYWFPETHLYEFYGASELSFVTVLDPEGNRYKPDSVGRPFHGTKIQIRREDGTEVSVDEVGKLFVQSEMLFSGYYRNEEETKRVLQDGWATVDDLAKWDQDGFIHMIGREKNMILYGGLNVFPEEVEKVIQQFPLIEEVVVIGIPDEYWGEKIIAVIVLKTGLDVLPRELQAHCREHLSAYKCPRKFIFMDSLPYTTSGKIARSRLKELITERIKR